VDKSAFDDWLYVSLRPLLNNSRTVEWLHASRTSLKEVYEKEGSEAAKRALAEIVERGDVRGV